MDQSRIEELETALAITQETIHVINNTLSTVVTALLELDERVKKLEENAAKGAFQTIGSHPMRH